MAFRLQVFNEKLVMSHLPTYADDKHPDNDKVRREQKSFSLLDRHPRILTYAGGEMCSC